LALRAQSIHQQIAERVALVVGVNPVAQEKQNVAGALGFGKTTLVHKLAARQLSAARVPGPLKLSDLAIKRADHPLAVKIGDRVNEALEVHLIDRVSPLRRLWVSLMRFGIIQTFGGCSRSGSLVVGQFDCGGVGCLA